MKELEVRQTRDGSKTLYLPELDETYHSSHGAKQEALHVFIRHGLENMPATLEPLKVFEMGFGTGLNAFLTADWALAQKRNIQYAGIELHPIPEKIWQQMDYAKSEFESEMYVKIMQSAWGKFEEIHPYFQLAKIEQDIQAFHSIEQVDLIYYDAFGPRAQAEMWDLPILTIMHDMLRSGGVFVTYCAQGQMKRNLKSLGFALESLPGPPGKREMTRAIKI